MTLTNPVQTVISNRQPKLLPPGTVQAPVILPVSCPAVQPRQVVLWCGAGAPFCQEPTTSPPSVAAAAAATSANSGSAGPAWGSSDGGGGAAAGAAPAHVALPPGSLLRGSSGAAASRAMAAPAAAAPAAAAAALPVPAYSGGSSAGFGGADADVLQLDALLRARALNLRSWLQGFGGRERGSEHHLSEKVGTEQVTRVEDRARLPLR